MAAMTSYNQTLFALFASSIEASEPVWFVLIKSVNIAPNNIQVDYGHSVFKERKLHCGGAVLGIRIGGKAENEI